MTSIDDVLAQLEGDHDDTGPENSPAGPSAPKIKPVYRDADQWVRDVFVLLFGEYKRQTSAGRGEGLRWCPRWWAHPLALDRLESLWRAWEALRLDPGTGLSVWYRDHFAPAVADLTGDHGPFRECDSQRHVEAEPAPALAAPQSIRVHFADKAPPVGGPPRHSRP
ncbi:DUF4913 domain-containing protein [Micromonospora sp. WMMA1363]|uniref:DUF4913 domain-containing protein n=1 Tax=Micromonospora sp. WMMA1363 TaxID=3053985 RepID=UPI00259D2616|nr:DUF4913 domain-containing protein [Micromonospora sp. WMMA1363]MDM4723487.1 DUF4913 domain-containing protein [Micromonospora sp. WMMA1363]